MNDVKGPPADMTFTLSITRKETGLTEHYQMEGHYVQKEDETIQPQEGEAQCPQP